MKQRTKTKLIVVRGVRLRVSKDVAKQAENIERELLREDWAKNRVD